MAYRLLINRKGEYNKCTGNIGQHPYWLIEIQISIEGQMDIMCL